VERETIAAVVVTFNRKTLLTACLDSLLAQTHPLDGIYIIDNHSTDGTYDSLLDRGLIAAVDAHDAGVAETVTGVTLPGHPNRQSDIHYVRLSENTGGAGGFHEGMKRAVEAGFDWLWVMDDDLRAAPEALAVLVQKKGELEAAERAPFVLNSLVLAQDSDSDDELAFPLQELSAAGLPKPRVYYWRLSDVQGQIRNGLYRWACPFNGMFLPVQAVTEVGLPNVDFFIWGDESDFLWRVARRFEIYTAVNSKVHHPRFQAAAFNWKSYYQIRNMFVVNRHFSFPVLRNLRLILLSLITGLRHGRAGLTLVLRAVSDGLAGRLGKREDIHP
jgi:GT2 family glycosyltransferase